MSCQQFLEKMARQRELSGNAFAAIIRDTSGFPCGIYPIDAYNVEASFNAGGDLILTFSMKNGKVYPFYYSDIIHLRRDFGDNDLFGELFGRVLSKCVEKKVLKADVVFMDSPSHGWWPPQRLPASLLIQLLLKITLPGRTLFVSQRLSALYYLADTGVFLNCALKTVIYLTNGSLLLEKTLFLPLHPIPPYPPFPSSP